MIAAVLAALALAAPALAAPHSLEVRFIKGSSVYSHAMKLNPAEQVNFAEPVARRGGGPAGDMIVNVMLLQQIDPGRFELSYQFEMSDGRTQESRVIQSQGHVALRPGDSMTVVECGGWTIELFFDSPAKKPAPFVAESSLNHRLTAEVSGPSRALCRQVVALGNQGNLVDGVRRGGRRSGTILNFIMTGSRAGGWDLQYQMEFTPQGGAGFRVQNTTPLVPGVKRESALSGYRLSLLAEGPAKAAAPAAAAAPAPAPKAEGAVPFLR